MNTWCCTASATSPQSTVQVYTMGHANTEQNEVYSYCQAPVLWFVRCDLVAPNNHVPWKTSSLANNNWLTYCTWKIAHTGEEQVALTGSFEACTDTGSLRPSTQSQIHHPPVLFHFPMTWVQWLKQLCQHWNKVKHMFNHVTHNIHETFQWQHFFKNEWSHVLLPNTGWNHISVMALGKLTCKANIVHFSIKTLDTWSLVVNQLIEFKKRFLLFVLLLQAICPHWLRPATALVPVSTCHVLPWSWNNCFLLASGTSFQVTQVSTWWIKLSQQHMPNCIRKAVGRRMHLDCSKWLDHWKKDK